VLPQCRYFVICRDGRVTGPGEDIRIGGEAVTAAESGRFILIDLIASVGPEPGEAYPIFLDRLYLFALMSGGSGRHGLSVELVRWYQGQQYQVFLTPTTPLDFGRDRAAARAYHVLLRPVAFPTAGQYTFRLLCDGTEIGRAELELTEPP
jgi:hypothetical protein